MVASALIPTKSIPTKESLAYSVKRIYTLLP